VGVSGIEEVFAFRTAVEGQVSGTPRQAGGIHFHAPPTTSDPVPRQLPPPPHRHVGRESALDELDRLRESGVGLMVVSGVAGVGKTALALRWLHELVTLFDDGQLFVDLTDPAGGPAAPTDVLEWFLISLGVPQDRVPLDPDQRAALFRSVTAHRQLMVLLDNAVSAAQVRALIPTGKGSLVVVTSRYRLSGLALDGAKWVDLAPLETAAAMRLFDSVVGTDRVLAEEPMARRVAQLCGGLPLALSIVAARMAGRTRRTFAREFDEVARDPLRGLRLDADVSVSVVLDWAAETLSEEARTAYHCCGWHPGREFGPDVVTAGMRRPAADVVAAIDDLVEANLLVETAEDRFTCHDLVRLHARGVAPPHEGERARRRMIEWYLDRTVAADLVIHPLRPRVSDRYSTVAKDEFADPAAAIAWLGAERANVRAALDVAATHGLDDLAWQFCEAQWGFFLHTRRYSDWIDTQLVGIGAAQRVGARTAEATLRAQLGYAYTQIDRHADAAVHSGLALDLATADDDLAMQATALEQLGLATRRDDPIAALGHFQRSRELNERIDRPRGVALCRRRVGEVLADLGRFDEAAVELTAVATTMAELGDPTQHARAVTMLGAVHLLAGRPAVARHALTEALAAMREFGSPYYQAEILVCLGDAADYDGDTESARRHWHAAADLYESVHDDKAAAIRSRLADPMTPHRTKQPE